MSGISAPINDFLARFKTMPGIKYFAIWNNQTDYLEKGESYDWAKPALFLEVVTPDNFMALMNGYSVADIDWCVHIVTEMFDAADGTMEQNLTIFDWRDKVMEWLSPYGVNAFKPTGCGTLLKISETQDYGHRAVYHYKIVFRSSFVDSKTSSYDVDVFNQNYVLKDPPIELDINATITESI